MVHYVINRHVGKNNVAIILFGGTDHAKNFKKKELIVGPMRGLYS
jgi:hypothetical protein